MALPEQWRVIRTHSTMGDHHDLIHVKAGQHFPHLRGIFNSGPPTPPQLAEAIGRAMMRIREESQ